MHCTISQHAFTVITLDTSMCNTSQKHQSASFNSDHPTTSMSHHAFTVIALDIFQTSVEPIRWQKQFTETDLTVTVTSQINCSLYYYQSSASNHPAPFFV